MSTKAIENFLQTAYTDERLAMLLAHAQDGKLSYRSCSCLIGAVICDHALHGANCACGNGCHNTARARIEGADEAEDEFGALGFNDAERRTKLIPLILAEIQRRESLRSTQGYASVSELSQQVAEACSVQH